MIKIIQGDITKLAVDAIVNAANQVMLGNAPKKLVSEGNFEQSENLSEAKALKRSRGGVDGAIHRAAGPELYEACLKVPEVRPGIRCPTGEARITPGFKLPAKYVIHTVGPVYRDGHTESRRSSRLATATRSPSRRRTAASPSPSPASRQASTAIQLKTPRRLPCGR